MTAVADAPVAPPSAPISLGGRQFIEIGEDTTAEQDDWVMGHVGAAGLVGVARARAAGVPARQLQVPPEAFDLLIGSGRIFELVAGTLVEVGQEWTPARGDEYAALFRRLRGEDKRLFQAISGAVLRGFFGLAGPSSPTSLSSSSQAAETGPGDAAPTSDAPRNAAAAGAEASATSAPGTTSPEP